MIPIFEVILDPKFLRASGTILDNAAGILSFKNLNNLPGRDLSLVINQVPIGRPRASIFSRLPMLSNNPPNNPFPLATALPAASFAPAPILLAIASRALQLLSFRFNSCLCLASISKLSLFFTLVGVPSDPTAMAIILPSESDVYCILSFLLKSGAAP